MKYRFGANGRGKGERPMLGAMDRIEGVDEVPYPACRYVVMYLYGAVCCVCSLLVGLILCCGDESIQCQVIPSESIRTLEAGIR